MGFEYESNAEKSVKEAQEKLNNTNTDQDDHEIKCLTLADALNDWYKNTKKEKTDDGSSTELANALNKRSQNSRFSNH